MIACAGSLAGLCGLVLPAVSSAATASITGSNLTFSGGAEYNVIFVDALQDEVDGPGIELTHFFGGGLPASESRPNCGAFGYDGGYWYCHGPGTPTANVGLGGGDDEFHTGSGSGPLMLTLDAGEGDDFLSQDAGNESPPQTTSGSISGGPGDDGIYSGDGASHLVLHGDSGSDGVYLDSAADPLTLIYAPIHASLDDTANDGSEGQAINIMSDVEEVWTGLGDDVIRLRPGPDTAKSDEGDDVVHANHAPAGNAPDSDDLDLGEGADSVFARDGAHDVINCGEVANGVPDHDPDTGEVDFFGIDTLIYCEDDPLSVGQPDGGPTTGKPDPCEALRGKLKKAKRKKRKKRKKLRAQLKKLGCGNKPVQSI